MDIEKINMSKKFKIPASSIALYVAFAVVALIAVASLINNIIYFNNIVASYVAQGYPAVEVKKELIPAQLLPGIFEPIAVYGGIAFILLGAGFINHRFSKCLILLAEDKVCQNATKESVSEENVIEENRGATEQAETIKEVTEVTDNSK
ncbi:MAG: hypothetical protein PHD36_03015 [Desulfotomaculaceae bacterium]|nr:hypothetical protein [Desulfotomaculaceae bacterium]